MLDKCYCVGSTFFVRKSAGLFDFTRLYKLFERKNEVIEKYAQNHTESASLQRSTRSTKWVSSRVCLLDS